MTTPLAGHRGKLLRLNVEDLAPEPTRGSKLAGLTPVIATSRALVVGRMHEVPSFGSGRLNGGSKV
ncbi:MAG: hypothetical protein V3R24_03660 [Gemmatimonadales bacterium]